MSQTVNETSSDAWYLHHFDHLSPDLAEHFHETLGEMRESCPVAHSDRYGGFWIATTYDDVLNVVQDWKTFSSAKGVGVPEAASPTPLLPIEIDPPQHRIFRKLINYFLSPTYVAPYEEPTRRIVTRLIDGFIEDGHCDFMPAFGNLQPRVSFFELVMHAPAEDIPLLSEITDIADGPRDHPRYAEAWKELHEWINAFVAERRANPGPDDIVEAVINADIDGRPINDREIMGVILLLLFGGFGTTAAGLGNTMVLLATKPDLLSTLRDRPELIPNAVEEFLRVESPVVCMARTATRDTELSGQQVKRGDRVMFQLAAANRDATQFERADEIDLERAVNRHLAFGGGPHRCAGSNLARMNLRISLEEIVARLADITLDGEVVYRTVFTRGPEKLPISFTPGPRLLA